MKLEVQNLMNEGPQKLEDQGLNSYLVQDLITFEEQSVEDSLV
jgi:hypothetical protein